MPTTDSIDRITPTRRPSDRVVMHQRWDHLLFVHWPAAPDVLARLLPPGLEVDTFEGRAFVGLVPFTMDGVRPRGLPAVRGLSRFHEINVRTYVHAEGRGPGVWFFSLDAASRIAVWLARRLYHLPYFHASMGLDFGPTGPDGNPSRISYRSDRIGRGDRPASTRLTYRPLGAPSPARPGTLEHFLIERYLLYAHYRGVLYRGQVHHSAYPVQGAELLAIDDHLIAAAGIEIDGSIPLVQYARGVRVDVYPPRRLSTTEVRG